ncbi:MAG: hypothetical protein WAV26_00940 [Candidatus Deferrimicrobium sp.]
MKKYFGIFLAAMLMVGAAGPAMAGIAATNLLRIVYDTSDSGTVEIGSDLGSAPTLTAGAITTNPFSVSSADLDHYSVVYLAFSASANQLWFTATSLPTVNPLVWVSTKSATNSTMYNFAAGTTTVGLKSANNSYWNKMDLGGVFGAVGSLNTFIPQPSNNVYGVEANLAALATGGYVDQTLYFYQNGLGLSDTGFTLRTLADGTTQVLAASAVPIPPSVLLLGSGLLGMIGIRRKIA